MPASDDFELENDESESTTEGESSSLLTRVDWDTILACSHVSTYKAGEALMREGEKVSLRCFDVMFQSQRFDFKIVFFYFKKMVKKIKPVGIMQIIRGSAFVEKSGKRVATVNVGQILGEISFLRNSEATADVVAAGDAVYDEVIFFFVWLGCND